MSARNTVPHIDQCAPKEIRSISETLPDSCRDEVLGSDDSL